MTVRKYASPEAFKAALEQRLKQELRSGEPLARSRQLVVFDRFLARVVDVFDGAVVLKGGLVLEMRLDRARTTKDIDLALSADPARVLARLQETGRVALPDFMTFEVEADPEHPTIQNDGMEYGGLRFRAECRLASKLYGQRFGIDIAFGDVRTIEVDLLFAKDSLGFAGVVPPKVPVYPIALHVAEKLHAYTLPRTRLNTRVKDLPDIALLASIGPIESSALRAAIGFTFTARKTHDAPVTFPAPPADWRTRYEAIAAEDELAWATLEQATNAVKTFLDPILAGAPVTAWDPEAWRWM